MIFLDIVGRCGNQMFQYAFAKKISLLNNDDEMIIDYYHVYNEAQKRNDETFKNDLDDFYASNCFTAINSGENKIYKYGSTKQIIVFKIYTKIKRLFEKMHMNKRAVNRLMYRIMCRYGIYWYYAPETLKPCKEKNIFIWGYFENPKYFEDIADILRREFTPKHKETEKNSDFYEVIRKENSVCVSFRKWNDNEPIGESRIVCNRTYYENALKYIKDKIPEAKLIVFSNDVEWVKREFDMPYNSIYEKGSDPIYEKIRLMYSCKHFVLSNSTFSWWAQFLGKDEEKIVISPACWFNDEKKDNPLIQSNFRKVSIKNGL